MARLTIRKLKSGYGLYMEGEGQVTKHRTKKAAVAMKKRLSKQKSQMYQY